jgi:hypothetical protein
MTEKKISKIFASKLKERLIMVLIGGIFAGGVMVWEYVQKGREQEKFEQFKSDALRLVEQESKLPNLLTKIMESDFIRDFADDKQALIESTIVDQVLREDSAKVGLQTYLGRETGMRDEDIYPLLAKLIKAYNDGQIMTEDDVKEMIRKRTINANF